MENKGKIETGEKIQFRAKRGKWFVVKKMDINENTEDIEIARLLNSIDKTINKKILEFLPFDIKKIEEMADEIYQKKKGRVKEEDIANALSKLKSPSTTRKLNNITELKEGKEILKIILNNIILERLGIKTKLDTKLIDKYIEKSSD
ncbi:DUF2666 domain-containing protein [Methanothermococcus okinawensis]|uniref:DUF2666 domain-containing protein n=1 Tax=Methanothermococcus okinawensis (strain DSM 14208 / JCM 11175 / IH1) TaxID=647113 RepID=F8AJK7_METOI|nr:DUF2666 domain-containing protein [Methanothermococcus okinawensis]AEH07193.1 hypothetical protein Metok_1225 [Methanothermococcus okinawensis IH1]